ncbi:hypothetical protein VTI74DRAFT_551 [Chaetomium olivicolor]
MLFASRPQKPARSLGYTVCVELRPDHVSQASVSKKTPRAKQSIRLFHRSPRLTHEVILDRDSAECPSAGIHRKLLDDHDSLGRLSVWSSLSTVYQRVVSSEAPGVL